MSNNFNWKFYVNKYPDLRGLNTYKKARKHWENYGKKEGRQCCPSTEINTSDIFDWKYYISRYKDLQILNSEREAWKHWLKHGKKEGRVCCSPKKENNSNLNHFKNISFLDFKININYHLLGNHRYIMGDVTKFYVSDLNCLFKKNGINIYFIENQELLEIIYFISFEDNRTINTSNLSGLNIFNDIIGFNSSRYKIEDKINLYYLYGKYNISLKGLGLELFYTSYINSHSRRYNKKLYTLIKSYYYGKTQKDNYLNCIKEELEQDIFHTQKLLLTGKRIFGYGGVQKTSIQIMTELDPYYDISIISSRFWAEKPYDLLINRNNREIPLCLFVLVNSVEQVNKLLNKNKFDYIVNNKMDSFFRFTIPKSKIICICHNSMDPFNSVILGNQSKIFQTWVITKFHRNNLLNLGLKTPIKLLNLKIDSTIQKYSPRQDFKRKVAFIGRLAPEKNISELISGINSFNSNKKNIPVELLLIGDGPLINSSNNKYIHFLGRKNFQEIKLIYQEIDFVISSSLTEGKPFSIIESLSHGIPCIHSNINGINDLIEDEKNGFLFELHDYEQYRWSLSFENLGKICHPKNKKNLTRTLDRAYQMDISDWNKMSSQCINLTLNKNKQVPNSYSLINPPLLGTKRGFKVFVNFRPNQYEPYGGGNINTHYLISNIMVNGSDFNLVFELEPDIDLYLVIDPLKKLPKKKYGLEDIVNFRSKYGGKILIRINDCDKTRKVNNKLLSREYHILKMLDQIDYFIFNSYFIQDYYLQKISSLGLSLKNNHQVIRNGCDLNLFPNHPKVISSPLKIVTHHMSKNINKGYSDYLSLWNYAKDPLNKIKFTFIGDNVPDIFSKVSRIGPFKNPELGQELNQHHVYISSSVNDSCPNHILEAISCGLPILYLKKEGGVQELCQMFSYKIGEGFSSFNELLEKIDLIQDNYQFYRDNLVLAREQINIKKCISRYYQSMLQLCSGHPSPIDLSNYKNDNLIIKISSGHHQGQIIVNENQSFRVLEGDTLFIINKRQDTNVKLINLDESYQIYNFREYKLDNNKVNLLLSSDYKYWVGLFASLNSVIVNTQYLEQAHFNFIIPIDSNIQKFSNLLLEFENKHNIILEKTIIYLDSSILDPVFKSSRCFGGGGHLLNIGNLSRLLIGELMLYKKLIYLDSDSVTQYDIIKKLINFNLEKKMYAPYANKHNSNKKKEIVIKLGQLLKRKFDWKSISGNQIDLDNYAYLGAPFITDCSTWTNIYNRLIELIRIHNTTRDGLFNLFTMSLQNILFYDQIGNIDVVLDVLQDLGSTRKKWEHVDLVEKDILDWSGLYKPWYFNGLYQHLWKCHDILELSTNNEKTHNNKDIVERNMY